MLVHSTWITTCAPSAWRSSMRKNTPREEHRVLRLHIYMYIQLARGFSDKEACVRLSLSLTTCPNDTANAVVIAIAESNADPNTSGSANTNGNASTDNTANANASVDADADPIAEADVTARSHNNRIGNPTPPFHSLLSSVIL